MYTISFSLYCCDSLMAGQDLTFSKKKQIGVVRANYLFTSSFCRNESGHTYGDKDCCCRGKRGEDPHNCWGVQELFQREVNVGDEKGEEKTCRECAGFTESFEVWTKKFTDYFLLVVSKTWNNIQIPNNYFCTNVMLGVFKNPWKKH